MIFSRFYKLLQSDAKHPVTFAKFDRCSSGEKRLVLAADASTLGQRFTLLVISVVYRGCGIPVAGKVVKATQKGSWQPHWRAGLAALEGAVPSDWLVLVTTDGQGDFITEGSAFVNSPNDRF